MGDVEFIQYFFCINSNFNTNNCSEFKTEQYSIIGNGTWTYKPFGFVTCTHNSTIESYG